MSPSQIFTFNQKLAGLSFNSKPLINTLTQDAAALRSTNAKRVVTEIENKIYSAHYTEKLPILYLIDSIVKNVGGEYVELFTHNLENVFCDAFEHPSNELSTRISYAKLLKTWPLVFPLSVIVSIQERVAKCMRKTMPHVVERQYQHRQVHVNPKFFQATKLPEPPPLQPSLQSSPSVPSSTFLTSHSISNSNLNHLNNSATVSPNLFHPSQLYASESTSVSFYNSNIQTVNHISPQYLLQELYSSNYFQCSSCGIRLSSREKMNQHLDNHFHFTHSIKHKAMARCWFPEYSSWISSDLISKPEVVAPAMESMRSSDIDTLPSIRNETDVIAEEEQDICPICQEQLEVYWNEEEQEWYFRDTIKQGSYAVHTACATIES
eukprot:gb/GECH01009340.1/.p1 GENE.gb/GECH01009340.1/~~gb/GECH01009340.1/.p1  ORF type:complete len:379 (+),score=61.93 gb/GECH01009340.1/:1-1137(+)